MARSSFSPKVVRRRWDTRAGGVRHVVRTLVSPAFGAGALVVALGLAVGGCGSSSTSPSPSIPPTSPESGSPGAGGGAPGTAGAASPAAPDLGGVLVQPSGFAAFPEDIISGPIQGADDVRNLFTDHPEDPAVIMGNGFVEGYARAWMQPAPPPRPFDAELPDTPLLTSIVLRFDTPAHASTVHEHFRGQNARAGAQFFAVPPELADGYGAYVKHGDTYFTYHYSVSWRRGDMLFDVALVYTRPQPAPDQVIAIAVAQDEAA